MCHVELCSKTTELPWQLWCRRNQEFERSLCAHVRLHVCVHMCAPVQVRVEAPTLGERGVFFSILWGLRQGEREAEHWEVQQLNSVHCATELGLGGHGVQHSSGALSIHTTAAVLWGRWWLCWWWWWWGGCITTLSDKTYCLFTGMFIIDQRRQKPFLHCFKKLMKTCWSSKHNRSNRVTLTVDKYT